MKTPKCALALSALILVASAASVAAVPDNDRKLAGGFAGTKIGESVSIEGFYGKECSDNGTDVSGAAVRYVARNDEYGARGGLIPELFVSVGGGYGIDCSAGDFLLWRACVGENVRIEFNRVVSAFVRAEFGLGIAYADLDADGVSTTDTDLGVTYGIGFGLQFDITERHGIVLAVDYIGMTAQPSFDVDGCEVELDKPEYVLFSIGYKYTY